MKIMDRMIVGLIELFTKIYWRKMHMEYKRNIYSWQPVHRFANDVPDTGTWFQEKWLS